MIRRLAALRAHWLGIVGAVVFIALLLRQRRHG